jgi:hypothetical protein
MKIGRREQYKIDRKSYIEGLGREKYITPDVPSDSLSGAEDRVDSTETSEKEALETTETSVRLRPEPTNLFQHMLRYNHLQARVIETLWSTEVVSLSQCVRPLMALANPGPFRPRYPDPLLPATSNGNCPYCNQNIGGMKHINSALHLLDCHCMKLRVEFCFDCATFIESEKTHTCPYSDALKGIYGVIVWRGLLIREGRCPFGPDHGCHDNHGWRDSQSLRVHVSRHLDVLKDLVACPHKNCSDQLRSGEDLRTHLHETHRIYLVTYSTLLAGSGPSTP